MFFSRKSFPRLGAVAAGALGVTALLVTVVPSRGQQNVPAARIGALGEGARAGRTRVNLGYTLASELQLRLNPRVRVTDSSGALEELLPALFLTRSPLGGECYRDLNTHTYRPGTYQVRAEVEYVDAGGTRRTLVSPAVSLTVPGANRTP